MWRLANLQYHKSVVAFIKDWICVSMSNVQREQYSQENENNKRMKWILWWWWWCSLLNRLLFYSGCCFWPAKNANVIDFPVAFLFALHFHSISSSLACLICVALSEARSSCYIYTLWVWCQSEKVEDNHVYRIFWA